MKFQRHFSPHHSSGRRIREYWFSIFGYDCHLRFVPAEFNVDVKLIGNLIDDGRCLEAKLLIDQAYTRWGCDPDLIRADTLNDFMNGTE